MDTTTDTSSDSTSFEPISLDKFKEALESLKQIKIEPRKCFYTNKGTYDTILYGMMTDQN